MMTKSRAISCLFLDIGEVLLTDGWDHQARRRAAKYFKLTWAEMEVHHNEVFAVYEERARDWLYLDCGIRKVPTMKPANLPNRILTINGGSSSVKFPALGIQTAGDHESFIRDLM